MLLQMLFVAIMGWCGPVPWIPKDMAVGPHCNQSLHPDLWFLALPPPVVKDSELLITLSFSSLWTGWDSVLLIFIRLWLRCKFIRGLRRTPSPNSWKSARQLNRSEPTISFYNLLTYVPTCYLWSFQIPSSVRNSVYLFHCFVFIFYLITQNRKMDSG